MGITFEASATSHDETTSLHYLKWQKVYEKVKPYQVFITDIPDNEDFEDTNLVFEPYNDVAVRNIRGKEDSLSLDENGFIVKKHKFRLEDFSSQEEIEKEYLPEIVELYKSVVDDVDEVFIFDWRIRRNNMNAQLGKVLNLNDRIKVHLLPAQNVHVDQSPATVIKRIKLQLGDRADELLRGRVQVINVWRPLYDTVEDWPLALCDARSVQDSDLIHVDHIRRHHAGEVMYATHSPEHSWHYLHRQTPDEVLVFKNFDSAPDVKAKYCPHVSFKHASIREDAPMRQSIEVRAFIFTYPKE